MVIKKLDNIQQSQLYFVNNTLLGTVDARKCTSLTGAIDLSGATNIEYVRFGGSAITSISLPVGGILKELELPETITNLTVRDQTSLTSFTVENDNYENITTLRVENCGSAIPVLDILQEIAANSRVRIIGFEMTVTSTTEVEQFLIV